MKDFQSKLTLGVLWFDRLKKARNETGEQLGFYLCRNAVV